jgi:hypothetical protein
MVVNDYEIDFVLQVNRMLRESLWSGDACPVQSLNFNIQWNLFHVRFSTHAAHRGEKFASFHGLGHQIKVGNESSYLSERAIQAV